MTTAALVFDQTDLAAMDATGISPVLQRLKTAIATSKGNVEDKQKEVNDIRNEVLSYMDSQHPRKGRWVGINDAFQAMGIKTKIGGYRGDSVMPYVDSGMSRDGALAWHNEVHVMSHCYQFPQVLYVELVRYRPNADGFSIKLVKGGAREGTIVEHTGGVVLEPCIELFNRVGETAVYALKCVTHNQKGAHFTAHIHSSQPGMCGWWYYDDMGKKDGTVKKVYLSSAAFPTGTSDVSGFLYIKHT